VTRVSEYVSAWLNRPQRTRRDDLLIAVVFAALLWVLGQVGGRLVDALGLIDFRNSVPIWAAALVGGMLLALGTLLGRRRYLLAPQAHELYTQHLRDALADLRKLTAGELPDFSLRDYIENGLFQPAHKLLTTRGRNRGEVRFSILHPDPDDRKDFVMSEKNTLYPALGHSMEGRQALQDGDRRLTGRTRLSNPSRPPNGVWCY
jgi:hypothetical protein